MGEGPLGDLPFGVKDDIDGRPYPATGGCPGPEQNRPEADATAVALLKAAGGNDPVKLNLHEHASGVTSDNTRHGAVANRFDPARVAGGSSDGNAAAVARGVVPSALGPDTGGSTRSRRPSAASRASGPRRGALPTAAC